MIEILQRRTNDNKKLTKAYDKLDLLLKGLNDKKLPQDLENEIQQQVNALNNSDKSDKELIKAVHHLYFEILQKIKKKAGIVTKSYYQNNWMVLGMSGIGLPIGALVYFITKNPAFLGIGLPIGLGLGMAIGATKDKKVKEAGLQIQIEEA